MAHSNFRFITQITEQFTEEIKTTIFLSVSLSFSPKIWLFHCQSPPSTSFDSRIFENVAAGRGTCEGSDERSVCVQTAQREDCWYGAGKQEGKRKRKIKLRNEIPSRAGHFFTCLDLINFL
jgi:hypothetical protein